MENIDNKNEQNHISENQSGARKFFNELVPGIFSIVISISIVIVVVNTIREFFYNSNIVLGLFVLFFLFVFGSFSLFYVFKGIVQKQRENVYVLTFLLIVNIILLGIYLF